MVGPCIHLSDHRKRKRSTAGKHQEVSKTWCYISVVVTSGIERGERHRALHVRKASRGENACCVVFEEPAQAM